MKQPVEQVQEIQILYEIAMSIGTSLDLRKMLKESLSTFLKKLDCSAGGIYSLNKSGDGKFRFEQIYAIPRNIDGNKVYQTALKNIPQKLTYGQLAGFFDQLPLSGQCNLEDHFYIMELPGFGLMILVKDGDDLAMSTIKSLRPLQLKLASACNACLTERALRESREQFRQVVSSISHHIYVTEFTADGGQLNRYISPNVEDLTGYPRGKFITDWHFWQSLIHPDDLEAAADQVKRFADGQNSAVEYRLRRADGSIFWVNDSGRVEENTVRQSLIVYGVVSDVTEHKRTEEVLARARDQALEASQLKTELLAKVSHELRTPLNAILGYADMLQQEARGPLSAKQHHAVDRIIINTNKLDRLVASLLDQAKMEQVELKLEMVPFSPTELIDNLESVLGPQAQVKGLQLTSHIAVDVPSILFGDFQRLQDVLVNLVGNGIKFTRQGGIHIHIYRFDATYWALQVSDTGPGIPAEAQAYIFAPFRQVDGSVTREHGGVGLGLSIVKQLITLMDGLITLESKVGQGSTFTVLLPLNPMGEEVV